MMRTLGCLHEHWGTWEEIAARLDPTAVLPHPWEACGQLRQLAVLAEEFGQAAQDFRQLAEE